MRQNGALRTVEIPPPSCAGLTRASVAARKSAQIDPVRAPKGPRIKPGHDAFGGNRRVKPFVAWYRSDFRLSSLGPTGFIKRKFMVHNTPLALLPLIAGILVLTARFYLREGAISIFSVSFMLATLAVAMLIGYMVLTVLDLLPAYAWVGFGGVGLLMTLGGVLSFYR
jgi:hypothetical protein